MAIYRIEWKTSAIKDLKQIDRVVIPKIVKAVESLASDPFPSGFKKIQGAGKAYRTRVGKYRIVYQVEDDLLCILVVRVGHRKDVYR
ncbi:MAG: type II toxin-antitoxin system RelE family toxin [Chitinispirillaceae bacterium]